MTKLGLLGVCLLSLAASIAPSAAQTIYLVSAAATKDPTIGEGAQSSRTKILANISAIASVLNLKFRGGDAGLTVVEERFNCDNIANVLDGVSPGTDDVLVFYYAGHGERRSTDKSPLPTLACDDVGLSLSNVVGRLAAKATRLTLVIADACNYALDLPPEFSVAALPTPQVEAYRRLFLRSAGLVVLDSSSPGEFSWYSSSGGKFTDQVIATLKNPPQTDTAGATWDSFISKVTEPMPVTPTAPVIIPPIPQPILKAGQKVLESPQALVRLTKAPQ